MGDALLLRGTQVTPFLGSSPSISSIDSPCHNYLQIAKGWTLTEATRLDDTQKPMTILSTACRSSLREATDWMGSPLGARGHRIINTINLVFKCEY